MGNPTRKQYEQIVKLAEINPTLNRCLWLYRCEEMTWEEMLITAIGHLVVDNKALEATLLDEIEKSVHPVIIKM